MPDLFANAENWVEIKKETYETEVINAETPVILEFWSKKCEKCQEFTPTMKEIASQYMDKIKFSHWECPCIYAVRELGVRTLPSIYFYKDGEILAKLDEKEQITEENVKENIEKLLE